MRQTDLIKQFLDRVNVQDLAIKRDLYAEVEKMEDDEVKFQRELLEVNLENAGKEDTTPVYTCLDDRLPRGIAGFGDSIESAILNYIHNKRESLVTETMEEYIKANKNVALGLAMSIDQAMGAHWFDFKQMMKELKLTEDEAVGKIKVLELFALIQKKRFGKTGNLLKFKILLPREKRIEILKQERERYRASINSIDERIRYIEAEQEKRESKIIKMN